MIVIHTGDGQITIDGDFFVTHPDGTVTIHKEHTEDAVAMFNLGAIVGLEKVCRKES